MANVKELYDYLDKKIPRALSCEWDNDGLMVCADAEKSARRVLLALDATDEVAKYAAENGFGIVDEALAREEDRIYEIICAEYSGKASEYSELSLLIGDKNMENRASDEALFAAFCEKQASALKKKIGGMKKGGADAAREEALLAEVEKLIG